MHKFIATKINLLSNDYYVIFIDDKQACIAQLFTEKIIYRRSFDTSDFYRNMQSLIATERNAIDSRKNLFFIIVTSTRHEKQLHPSPPTDFFKDLDVILVDIAITQFACFNFINDKNKRFILFEYDGNIYINLIYHCCAVIERIVPKHLFDFSQLSSLFNEIPTQLPEAFIKSLGTNIHKSAVERLKSDWKTNKPISVLSSLKIPDQPLSYRTIYYENSISLKLKSLQFFISEFISGNLIKSSIFANLK